MKNHLNADVSAWRREDKSSMLISNKTLEIHEILPSQMFFDNLPELLRPEKVASLLGISIRTIYSWRYRQKQKRVPEGLFLKFNRILYLNTKILRMWIAHQNASGN